MDVELIDQKGNDILAAAGEVQPVAPADLPPARARPGESRKQTWERLRQEARAAGMSKPDAYQYATREVDRVRQQSEPPAPDPPPVVVAEPPAAPATPPAATESGLAGLGDLPPAWPTLPANASLVAEIAWVQANRLRVRQGDGVDLSLALGPAPSYAALSWLETSILYPAKFADVCVKATADAHDDQADVRREKLALAEVQGLLSEAMGAAS